MTNEPTIEDEPGVKDFSVVTTFTSSDLDDLRRYWYLDGQLNDGALVAIYQVCNALAEGGIILPYENLELPLDTNQKVE